MYWRRAMVIIVVIFEVYVKRWGRWITSDRTRIKNSISSFCHHFFPSFCNWRVDIMIERQNNRVIFKWISLRPADVL
jgi:hypothetical protein